MSPLDTAVYWTEYVLRHRGAPQLRSKGADLPWYKFLLLDVAAVLMSFIIALYYIVKVVCIYTLQYFIKKFKRPVKSKDE